MNTLEIIEGQKKLLKKKFPNIEIHVPAEWAYYSGHEAIDTIFNWHKRSIIQILEAEVERKRGTIKIASATCPVTNKFLLEDFDNGYNQAIEQDITHLTNIINKLK